MDETVRSFLAIPIDPGPVRLLTPALERLRSTGADVKWVDLRTLHVTLKFLGDVDAARRERVMEHLRALAGGTPCMTGRIHTVGAFPGLRSPRVVWAGMSFVPDAMHTLVSRLETELEALGFARERRPFSGHVTLGRTRSPRGQKALTAALEALAASDFGSQPVDRIVYFRSELFPAGPVYTPLAEFALASKELR